MIMFMMDLSIVWRNKCGLVCLLNNMNMVEMLVKVIRVFV